MKKLFLLILFGLLFGVISRAQPINMRNRSAWKAPLKQDAPVKEADAKESETEENEDTASVQRITEVVVTAARTEQKLEDVGRSVSVISAGDIKNSGANSLSELLNMTEGIYITGSGQNFGSNQSMFMRGANSNQSVIMIDGITISDPSTPTNALDLSELSLSEIDHVEIVRGSHSTLYGSSAIGGVINIITNKKKKEGLNINATGTTGSFGKETSLIGENIGMNYTFKNGLYTNMNFNNITVNGIDATVDTSTVAGRFRDMDGMTHFDFGGKAGYKTNRWDVSVSGKKTEKTSDIDDAEFNDDDNYRLDFERRMVTYSAACKLDTGLSVSLNGGRSFMGRTALNDSSLIDNNGNYDKIFYRGDYSGETFTNELQLNFNKEDYSLVLGGGSNSQRMNQRTYLYYFDSFVTQDYVESIKDLDTLHLLSKTSSFFILAELKGTIVSQKAKAFTIGFGARSNNNNTFGSSVTYQVNPMVKVSSTSTIYGNISSGYNAPSLYQLHTPEMDAPAAIPRGNVNLRPESSVTKEFGVYQKINDKTGIRMSFYKTVISDVVEYVYLWDKNTAVGSLSYPDYKGDTYLNLGNLTTEGIELDAHSAMGKKFLITGNFSWMRGKQNFYAADIDTVKTEGNHVQLFSNGQFLEYKYQSEGLTRRPVTANLTVTYMPATKVFFKAVLKYVSKRNDVYYDYMLGPYGAMGKTPVQSYTLLDLVSGVKFSQYLSGLVRVENVFNVSYSEIRGFSNRGRGFYISINYTF
ncbi:MAG: TonB-dependent receptor [Bacteroidetes bacterium]|nr:MAG: TonB-dependent receptor [Bacteroidota bacterium]